MMRVQNQESSREPVSRGLNLGIALVLRIVTFCTGENVWGRHSLTEGHGFDGYNKLDSLVIMLLIVNLPKTWESLLSASLSPSGISHSGEVSADMLQQQYPVLLKC